MKTFRLITILYTFCFFLQVSGQTISQDQVPASVLSAFSALHSSVSPVWTKERWGHYEATFTKGRKKMKSVFDANGLLQRNEELIPDKQIPIKIREHASKLLEGFRANEAWLVTTPDDKKFYLLLMKK